MSSLHGFERAWRRRDLWRARIERHRRSRIVDLAVVLLFLVALVAAIDCTPRAVVRPTAAPPPAPDLGRCDLGQLPKRARFATTPCAFAACYDEANETALLDELESRRDFDERVAACLAPDEPPDPPAL